MSRKTLTLVLVLFAHVLLFAAACNEQPTPTATLQPPPTVTASQATAAPAVTDTAQPPTPTVETAEQPTATSDATTPTVGAETPAVTVTATNQATSEPAALAITTPVEGETWNTGSSVTVSGAAPAGADSVSVTMRAGGLTLDSAEAAPDADGQWEVTLTIPAALTGTATLQVTAGEDDSVELPVRIALAGATSGPAISLDYPQDTSTVVSGHVLFFTGVVQRPADEMVTIAVLFEECETVASTTSFTVGEGGQWWGYLVVPETVFGPGCALAYTGEFGEDEWRAAHAPIEILEVDAEEARGLYIGNFDDSELTPGESVTVFGSAYNAPNNRVQVALEVEGTSAVPRTALETVAQGTATTDGFGYWEINLVLPPDTTANGTGQFRATVSYEDGEISETRPFQIVPRSE